MIKTIFTFLILIYSFQSTQAQTIKNGVLIAGDTPAGFAAAIQSARSGAKTQLLIEGAAFKSIYEETQLTELWKIKNHFINKIKKEPNSKDSIPPTEISPEAVNALVKSIADTTKNLTVIYNYKISKLELKGKNWDIRLSSGTRLKPDVVVDATEKHLIASLLRTQASRTVTPLEIKTELFDTKVFRSGIARGVGIRESGKSWTVIPTGSFIHATLENFVIIPKSTKTLMVNEMWAGQAAGIIAAYCAFFQTSTKEINIRIAQGELLAFGAKLVPLSDVPDHDPNSSAIQRVVLSGLITPFETNTEGISDFKLDTAASISTREIQAPIQALNSRSQIWFADHQKDTMLIEDAISLFKFTAHRGDELVTEIEESWVESFRFNTKFDLKKVITRKEFAVLADRYVKPFNVRVDFQGNLKS